MRLYLSTIMLQIIRQTFEKIRTKFTLLFFLNKKKPRHIPCKFAQVAMPNRMMPLTSLLKFVIHKDKTVPNISLNRHPHHAYQILFLCSSWQVYLIKASSNSQRGFIQL
eukprot:NODE_35_length_36362_cov_0.944434.p33 type:complete len:109 gc:universal NODE_35_length_36362_cov_0.944434:13356-13682(+)